MKAYIFNTKSRIFSLVFFIGISIMEVKSLKSYVLQTNEGGQKALSIQQNLFRDYSVSLLQKAELKPGDTVWDIGCGNGEMAAILAELVGPYGTVYALDQSQEQLDAARKKLTEAGYKNVVYVQKDLENWEPQPNSADLVFSRFIFMHLKKPDAVVAKVATLLKAGGRFVMQEPTWKERKTVPELTVLRDFFDKATQATNDSGVDTEYGDKLSTVGNKNSLVLVHTDEKPAIYNRDAYAELMTVRIEEFRPIMIKAKVATEKDFEIWKDLPQLIKAQSDSFIGQAGVLHGVVYKKSEK